MLLKPARHCEASAEADGQFDDFNPPEIMRINAQHFMNLIPKVAKIDRKRLFTSLPKLIYNDLSCSSIHRRFSLIRSGMGS
jgi:hypothetical protein